MKVVTVLCVLAAALVVAVALLLPVPYTVLGSTGNCGLPVATALQDTAVGDEFTAAVAADCITASRQRVILGLVVGFILVFAGVATLPLPGGFLSDRR